MDSLYCIFFLDERWGQKNSRLELGETIVLFIGPLSHSFRNTLFKYGAESGHRLRTRSEIENKLNENSVQLVRIQGSHSTWKTWKNESTPGKPGSIIEFWKI